MSETATVTGVADWVIDNDFYTAYAGATRLDYIKTGLWQTL